ncbi:hypothetical protein JYU20_02920 [Bacteroidales bacterium AH-315-I05]|nr:hypothetical protein [Bacteroidales bacterium AH-315-I05]
MKKLMQIMMLNCEQATFLVTKETSGTITFSEKIKMQFHLLVCKYCRLFKKQSTFLSENINHQHQHSDKCLPDCKLEDSRKARMQEILQAELKKGSEEN